MDKEDVVYIYNGILAIKKNEILTFDNVDFGGGGVGITLILNNIKNSPSASQ